MHCEEPIPIYAATITPAGVQAAAEVADGFFPIWMDPEQYSVFKEPIEKGFKAAGGGKSLSDFDVAPFVTVIMGDDVKQCMMPIRGNMALYIGGMGAKGKNFYNDYATRLGFGAAAEKIQDLYLRRQERRSDGRRAGRVDRRVSSRRPGGTHSRSRTALEAAAKKGPGRLDADRQRSAEGARADGGDHALRGSDSL